MRRLLRWGFNGTAAACVVACVLWAGSLLDDRFGVHFWHGRTRIFLVADGDTLNAAKAEWRDYFPYNVELDDRNTWKLLNDYGSYGLRPAAARPLGHGLPVVECTDPHGRYWLADLPPPAGLVPITLLAAAWAVAAARRRRRRRRGPGLCLRCGYDLRGNPGGRCSECGEEVPAERKVTA